MMLSKLRPMLVRHEGLKLKVYKCPAGRWTIGVGRNVEDLGLTRDEAMHLLDNDIRRVHAEVKRVFPWFPLLDEPRQLVLMNMAFNLGTDGLIKFTQMLEAIKRKDWTKAAEEMRDSKWAKQVGSRAIELSLIMKTGLIQ